MESTIGAAYLDLSDDLTRFLCTRNLVVLDVVRGAAPDIHRLLLGPGPGFPATHVVAVSRSSNAAATFDNEHAVLVHAARVLPPVLRRCLPRVIERLNVGASVRGLAMLGAPHPDFGPGPHTSSRELLTAMSKWLEAVWSDTADGSAPVDLGKARVESVLAHDHLRHVPARPAVDLVRTARARLAEFEVQRTLTHGCLCPRHVNVAGSVVGVDDWGLGSPAGDPLRDAGRFAVSVADGRLPEVLAGRTSFAHDIRRFVTSALRLTPVPQQLWRDVLLLAQLELAFDAAERGNPHEMARLSRAVRTLQVPKRTR